MGIYLGTNEVSVAGTNGGFMLNGHLLATKTYSINLGQTNYSSLTLSTTAQNLTLPATSYTTTASTTVTCFKVGSAYDGTEIDFNQHDYIVFMECVINYNYGSNNVSSMIHGVRSSYGRDFQEGRYASSVDSATGKLTSALTKGNSYIQACYPLLYQKADGTYGMTTSQGIYHNGTSGVSFQTNSNYIDLKLGTICVKAHDTYCPVSSLELINPAATTVNVTWYIYEGDTSMYGQIYKNPYALAANA